MASAPAPNVDAEGKPATPLADASSNPVVAKVLSNFVKQYETRDTKEQDQIIDEAYSANAVFDDNLFHVHTPKNIKPQFHAVAKMFKSVKVENKESTFEGPDSDGNSVLKVYNVQEYVLGSRNVVIECDSTFKLNSEGKIMSHYDVWRDRPANFGILKRVGGSFGSWVMRLVRY